MIRVLLVDDHDLVRTGVKRLIDDIDGLDVLAEAGSGEEAVGHAQQQEFDVVLLDLNMPGMGGLQTTKKLLEIDKHLKIIVVTVIDKDPYPQKLFKAGAKGYLSKACTIDEIVLAIREVYYGRRYISVEVAQKMTVPADSLPADTEANPFEKLSSRELQVMMMSMQGMKGQEISVQLKLSPKTVSTYRYRLFEKLQVKNDVELTRLAIEYGLVDDEYQFETPTL